MFFMQYTTPFPCLFHKAVEMFHYWRNNSTAFPPFCRTPFNKGNTSLRLLASTFILSSLFFCGRAVVFLQKSISQLKFNLKAALTGIYLDRCVSKDTD